MKKTLSLLLMIITILFIFSLSNYVCAASSSMSTSTSSATVGDTITVTVKVNAAQWNLKLTANGTELDTWAETLNYSENLSKTFTVSYKPTKSGTVEFVLSGDYTDVDQTNKEINITKSVTVKEKSTSGGGSSSGGSNSGNSGNSGNSSGNNNGSTTTQKPNFKSADRTVYTTGTTNLRSSWSTSSSATTVPAGTALTLTGTSSETINGYVWYRVKYNGATKYVASNLVTNTKPQEKKETEKSDNNDLASLEIEGVTLEPSFSKDVTEYTVQLKDDVTELNIDAQAESSKAKVKISGNEDLKDGENTITITVTAEDESTKEYTIKAIKGEGSSASPVDNSVLKLSNLEISGVDFAGIFNPDTHSYELNLNISVKNLKITATPNQEGATVEIIGNEN